MSVLPSLKGLRVAGVDEAGRGPLAGPVVVASVILDPARRIPGLADSKVLSAARREELESLILAKALAYSIVAIEVDVIDRINIYWATMEGMRRALEQLHLAPEIALVDGNRLPPGLRCAAKAVVNGDATVKAISAASILAKVYRDRLMCALDPVHPGYGFSAHKGYSTPEHLAALRTLGPCPIHRRSFAPVANAMQVLVAFEPSVSSLVG